MSKDKRVSKGIAGLKLSKDARAAAESLLESKKGSEALAAALNTAILTTATKFKTPAPAAPVKAKAADKPAKVKKDKADKKAKKEKDKKDKKPKDKKAKGKTANATNGAQEKGAATGTSA